MIADRSDRLAALTREFAAFRRAESEGDTRAAWGHLERAHIVAQPLPLAHLQTHLVMLRYAVLSRDTREALGQILRLGLAVPGNLLGRLPAGNTGRARASAFAPMAVPADLARFVGCDGHETGAFASLEQLAFGRLAGAALSTVHVR